MECLLWTTMARGRRCGRFWLRPVLGPVLLVVIVPGLLSAEMQVEPSPGENAPQQELESCWQRLAGTDPEVAARAVETLIGRPDAAVAFLAKRTGPLLAPEPKRIEWLIAQLDDDRYEVRSKAFEELRGLDRAVEPALRAAMEGKPSAEVRQSIRRLLAAMDVWFAILPQHYQLTRAAEVLDAIDTEQSRRLHQSLMAARPRPIISRELHPLAHALASGGSQLRAEAAVALGQMGSQAQPLCQELVKCLAYTEGRVTVGNWSSAVSGHAERALTQIGKPAVPALIDGLAADDKEVRKRVAELHGRLKDPRSIGPLIAMLHDEDRLMRGPAASALRRFGPPAAAALIRVLEGPDTDAHASAVYALQGCPDPKAIGPLIAALKHEQKAVRENSQQALRRIGPPAVEALIGALGDESWQVREGAARALFSLRDRRTLEPLLARLKDPRPEVRLAAAQSVGHQIDGNVTDARVVEALTAALKDPSEHVRMSMLSALERFPFYKIEVPRPDRAMIALLDDPSVHVRCTALRTLGTYRVRRAVESIVPLLKVGELRDAAAGALGSIGDRRAIEPLRALLPEKNAAAIRALGELHDHDSVEAIIPLLKDTESPVRHAAAKALGQMEDPRAVEPLIAALRGTLSIDRRLKPETRNFQHAVAEALGHLGDPRAVEPMLDSLREPQLAFDRFGRQKGEQEEAFRPGQTSTAWSLFRLGKPAVKPLCKALDDPSVEVRGVSAWVFEQWVSQGGLDGDDIRPAIEPLARLLDDPSSVARINATMTLGHLRDPRAVKPLTDLLGHQESMIHGNAAATLSRYRDPESVALVREKLDHPQARVRAAAAKALGWMKDPKVAAPLLAAVEDDSAEVRAQAARSLGLLGTARAVDPLIRMLKDAQAEPRLQAAEALGRIGDTKAVEPVAALIADEDFKVRIAAGKALTRLNDPRGRRVLADALNDPDRRVRYHAAMQLGFYNSANAGLLEVLVAALKKEKDGDIRRLLVRALDRIPDRRVVEPLIASLGDHFGGVQCAAGTILIERKELGALPQVLALLEHVSTYVRETIAYRLRQIDDPRVVEALLKVLDDPQSKVRTAAIGSLGVLRAEPAVDPLISALADRVRPVRDAAAEALQRITGESFGPDQQRWRRRRDKQPPP